MAKALRSLPNDRLRYQQLMALAGKLEPMPADLKIPENKVPGCLSTVHVHATLQGDGTVAFQGDSDALISKGLVALLVRGLNGCKPEDICRVKPEFIQSSGISASLTPGRNNGFSNMFKLMIKKTAELSEKPAEAAAAFASERTSDVAKRESEAPDGPPVVQLYSTLSRKKQPLRTEVPGEVNMYVCGVTVYDLCHLGHARIMVFFDMAARYLKQIGYKVKYVRNVTDIDDKIIKRALEAGESAEALARRMEEEMQKDCLALGCVPPDVEPRVSEHIPEIINMVEQLVGKDHAYQGGTSEDASGQDVYFRVRSFPGYGRLSGVNVEENQAGARVEVDSRKEAAEDFVLWKGAKPDEPSWESPWGPGRPGWHIECSAMSCKHLGKTLDIHGGGPDLVFPHHENEIAQSEACNCQTYAHTWMHCAPVRAAAGEEKMSKSLGNFVSIRDVLDKYEGETIRFYLLSSQYRQPLPYSEENLAKAHERLLKMYSALRGVREADSEDSEDGEESDALRRFHAALQNDFDTVSALAAMDALSRELLQAQQAGADAAPLLARQLRSMGAALGVLQRDPDEVLRGGASADTDFEARVEGLIADRTAARKAKDWAKADAARDELQALGVVLEDTPQGTTWRMGASVAA